MSAKEIAHILLSEKAVFLRPHEPFTWTSGIKSPIYCDNRLLISKVSSRKKIISAFTERIKLLEPDVIAGTATAGIPWAAWIAYELKLPLLYVRSSGKDHGRKNAIEGEIIQNKKVVLIEDLISTGKSSIEAAQKLIDEKMEVITIMSIFSYNFEDTKEIFKKHQLCFESLSNFDILAECAFNEKMLDNNTLKEVLEWRKGIKFP